MSLNVDGIHWNKKKSFKLLVYIDFKEWFSTLWFVSITWLKEHIEEVSDQLYCQHWCIEHTDDTRVPFGSPWAGVYMQTYSCVEFGENPDGLIYFPGFGSIWSQDDCTNLWASLHSHICPLKPSERTRIKFVSSTCLFWTLHYKQQALCDEYQKPSVKAPTSKIELIHEISHWRQTEPASDDHNAFVASRWRTQGLTFVGPAPCACVCVCVFNYWQALLPLISLQYITARQRCAGILLTGLQSSHHDSNHLGVF